ncbi:hypothetical protein HS055_10980 [Mannheimia haemolytica]|uniref:hypothetical protein n=1 Tax=Mannheimia haemolytica TaxID=75985 RepID=UPI0038F73AE3
MKKIILLTTIMVSACTTQYKQDYTTKPTFCYQLAPSRAITGEKLYWLRRAFRLTVEDQT